MTDQPPVELAARGEVPLHANVRRLWRIRALLVAIPVVGVSTIIVAVAAELGAVGVALVLGSLVVVVAVVFGITSIAWRAWRFEVNDEVLVLRHGVWIRSESWVPYHRVQHIDLEAGPLERQLGLTSLVVRTASAATDGEVPGLLPDDAAVLRRMILDRAGIGDAV